ncbi:MAG: Hsp70 family protein [Microcystis panniformis]
MAKVIGIDLGTTYCAVAYTNKYGKQEIIPNREGERITPSVVLFEDRTPVIGSIAKRSAVAMPLDTVQFVKRYMGEKTWRFITEDGDEYTSEEISAFILKRLKEDAETTLGETIKGVVITVPAYFNDAQRKATMDAGKIAGLNVLRIINEPTAAALAYGINQEKINQKVLVYDLGGGTFDVTIMEIKQGEINVIATGGDKNLGGFDWDNKIMEHLNEEFKKESGIDLFDDPTLTQDLRDKAEIAKKNLSSKSTTKVFLSAGGKTISISITVEKFQEITNSLLQRTETITELVLEDSKLTWKDIDKVLLVGGSTRMKAVPTLIEKMSGKKPSMELHPDEAVAMGAAFQAELLQIQQGASDLVEVQDFPSVEIKDVTSHSIGMISVDERMRSVNSIILKKNTVIPCQFSKTFYTVRDNQQQLLIQVTEGESNNVREITVKAEKPMRIKPYPKNSPIRVDFEYDANQMISIKVFDLAPKKPEFIGEIQIEARSLTEEQVEEKQQRMSLTSVS